jgi:hypothetical protein
MSRVFEALTKASQERERQAESSNNDLVHVIHDTVPADVSSQKTDFPSERRRKAEEVRVSLPKSVGSPKSWRERLEELFFG